MYNKGWAARQWARIEDEYNEPPDQVVRVMLFEMHIPVCQAAELLYVSEKTLRKWLRGWSITPQRAGYHRRVPDGKVMLRARALGFESITQAIAHYRADGLRWEDVQAALRCASSTISRHMPEDAKGRYCVTAIGRATKQRVRRTLNEEGRYGLGFRNRTFS